MATSVKLHNRQGEPVDEMSATDAKNAFGQVLDTVERKGVVAITRHNRPRAVVLSMEEYLALTQGVAAALAALEGEFDGMLEAMNAPGQRAAMHAAFESTPVALGKVARKAARRARD